MPLLALKFWNLNVFVFAAPRSVATRLVETSPAKYFLHSPLARRLINSHIRGAMPNFSQRWKPSTWRP
jgi:hypothetical protein